MASQIALQAALCAQTGPGRRGGFVEASFLSDTHLRRQRMPLGGKVWAIPWKTATKIISERLRVALWDVAAAQRVTGVRVSLNGLRLSLTG